MKVKLVFERWENTQGENVGHTEEGIELSLGIFHAGSTFDAEITLDDSEADELRESLGRGFRPVFYVPESS